jgi:hypothetical protein
VAEYGPVVLHAGTSAPDEQAALYLDTNTSPPTIKVQTAATAGGTGPVAVKTGEAATIANDAVSNAMLANMAEATIKGRAAGAGTGDPTDLTAAQARTAMGLGTVALSATGDFEAAGAVATHAGQADPHTVYQKESEKDQASGYAGLSAASRVTKGTITQDDIISDSIVKGLVLKDDAGTPHYWRVRVNTSGVLVTTDLGTSAP